MECNCNNNNSNGGVIPWVRGNRLPLIICVYENVVTQEQVGDSTLTVNEMTRVPYTIQDNDTVTVIMKSGFRQVEMPFTTDGNKVMVTDNGELPTGAYTVEVTIERGDGARGRWQETRQVRIYENTSDAQLGEMYSIDADLFFYAKGDTGTGIADITNNHDGTLTITMTDGTSYVTDALKGDKGDKGDTGERGVSIESFDVTGQTDVSVIYTVTFSDDTTQDIAVPKGPQGDTGLTGNGISSTTLNSDYTLTIAYTDGTTYTTPSIRGAQGAQGVSVIGFTQTGETATNTMYNLVFSDGRTQSVAIPKGTKGDKGDTGNTGAQGAQGPKGDTVTATDYTLYNVQGSDSQGAMSQDATTKAISAQTGYYTCGTISGTAEKVVTVESGNVYKRTLGGHFKVKMTNKNTAASGVTLQIGSETAAALWYNGAAASADNSWEKGEVISVYYDGTYYQASNAQGGGGKAEKIKYDNSQSGLTADNVQEALDEVDDELTELTGELTDVEDYVMPLDGVDLTYDQTALVNNGQILQNSGATRSFSGFKTSGFIEIPKGTKYLYTSNLYMNDANTFIGLKFFTSNSTSGVISTNVAASGGAIPTTIDMEEWPTAKYLRFCSSKSTASVRFYAEAGQSQLINELISQQLGQSTVVTISQKVITDEFDDMANDIAEITADGIDFTFDSSNSSMASNKILFTSGSTSSFYGYSTSALLDIPARTKYLDTYGLYRNDANTYIGLVLFDESGTKLANVCASGEAIPSTIDLATNYPTAAKLRWCTHGNANAYVRCYSVSAIKTAVLSMVDDQVGQNEDVLMSQKGITDAIANMAEELKTSEYIELQNDSLVEDSGNWTFGTAWSYSANGATPPDVGAANYMRNTSIYYSDRRFMRISALMGADTKLIITCSYGSSLNAGEGASAFGVDFANKNLIIYGNTGYGSNTGDTQATSEGYDLTKTVESVDIPDAMIGARKYVIELRKYGTISQLTLMDTKTGASVSVFHDGWACGRQNQLYGFYCESGTLPTLSNFGVYSAKNPDIVFAGDSITEGVYVSDRQYTYANRFRSDMPSKSVVVSARGGQTISGLMSLFTTEWNIVRPKAISLLIGANGGNSASNFTAFKNACDAIGAKLYVHYCSCRTGRDLSETNNTLVPNLHLESAHFDWATATDNTPNSSYSNINSSLFADSTHPNITGQAEMYKRLKIDCPSMYM